MSTDTTTTPEVTTEQARSLVREAKSIGRKWKAREEDIAGLRMQAAINLQHVINAGMLPNPKWFAKQSDYAAAIQRSEGEISNLKKLSRLHFVVGVTTEDEHWGMVSSRLGAAEVTTALEHEEAEVAAGRSADKERFYATLLRTFDPANGNARRTDSPNGGRPNDGTAKPKPVKTAEDVMDLLTAIADLLPKLSAADRDRVCKRMVTVASKDAKDRGASKTTDGSGNTSRKSA